VDLVDTTPFSWGGESSIRHDAVLSGSRPFCRTRRPCRGLLGIQGRGR
jgi:hypothetical protein